MIKDHNWHEMILCMIRWLSMAWGAFLPHLISGPPTRCQAVYRCF